MDYAFVSHAIKGDAAFARRLASDLRRHDIRVWIAPDSIPFGKQWQDAIQDAVEQCNLMLLVATPEAVASNWVRTEMSMAISRHHDEGEEAMRVIPIFLKPCRLPLLWKTYQGVSFEGDYERCLRKLIERIGVRWKSAPKASWPWIDPIERALFGTRPSQSASGASPPPSKTPATSGKAKPLPGAFYPPFLPWGEALGAPSHLSVVLALSSGDKAREKAEYEEAIQHYTRVIEMIEKAPFAGFLMRLKQGEAYYKRGRCYMSLDFQNVWQRVNRLPQFPIRPGQVPFPTLAARSLLSPSPASGNFHKAQSDLKRAEELGYKDPDQEGKKGSGAKST